MKARWSAWIRLMRDEREKYDDCEWCRAWKMGMRWMRYWIDSKGNPSDKAEYARKMPRGKA